MAGVAFTVGRTAASAGIRWVTRNGLKKVPEYVLRSRRAYTQRQWDYALRAKRDIDRIAAGAATTASAAAAMELAMSRKRRQYRKAQATARRAFVGDSHPGTVGLVRSKYTSDRKDKRKVAKIVSASERYVTWIVRGLNQWNSITGANRGYYSLANYTTGANADRIYPIHCWNLTAVPQGAALIDWQAVGNNNVAPLCGFALRQAIGTNPAGTTSMGWNTAVISTLTASGANGFNSWSVEQVSDLNGNLASTGPIGALGRKHYLDWMDIRLMVYGKRKHDARITMELVRFDEDIYCPEYYVVNNPVNNTYFPSSSNTAQVQAAGSEVGEYWRSRASALVNNPITPRPTLQKKKVYTCLYKKTFNISGKSTDEANADVNVMMHKFFKRYGWLRDHTDTLQSLETDVDLQNEFSLAQQTPRQDFQPQPNKLRDNIYLLMTCETPHDYGVGVLTDPGYQDFQASYDLVIRKKTILDLA